MIWYGLNKWLLSERQTEFCSKNHKMNFKANFCWNFLSRCSIIILRGHFRLMARVRLLHRVIITNDNVDIWPLYQTVWTDLHKTKLKVRSVLDSDQIFLPFRENCMTVVSLPFFSFPFLDIAKLTYFSTRWQKYLGST